MGNIRCRAGPWRCPWHCAELYFKKHPHKLGKVVVVHAIPPTMAIRFYRPVSDEQIHCLENLRVIKDDANAIPTYLRAYGVWDRFLVAHPEPTLEEILKARNDFDRELKSLH